MSGSSLHVVTCWEIVNPQEDKARSRESTRLLHGFECMQCYAMHLRATYHPSARLVAVDSIDDGKP